MRLQLAAIGAVLALAGTARADGSVSVRGVYYKERATRVMQPMLDGMFEVGTHGTVTGHLLVDAITSASSSSGSAGSAFTERRYEGGGGYTHDFGRYRVGGDAKISHEPDYQALYAGVRGELDLAQKNATLAGGLGVTADTVSAGEAQGLANPMIACKPSTPAVFSKDCSLSGYDVFLSGSQILTRRLVVGASYDLSQQHGYLSNPYRQVVAGLAFAPERHPDERFRQAFAASVRYYLDATSTTIIGAYRYYRDDWKVHAHTPELRIVQEVGRTIDAAIRFRYYRQTQAFFYKPRYETADYAMQAYLSDDPKLTKFDGETMEAKLGVRGETFGLEEMWGEARFEGILEYVVQHNRFGNAVIAQFALTLPFEY